MKMTKKDTKKEKYLYAYDPIVRRRVVYVVINGWAISLLTKHKFKYNL